MRKLSTLFAAFVMIAAMAVAGPGASALDYPTSPVSVIVAYGAGGGTDLVSRALADTIKGSFPKGIAVENRTGGGGSVGMSYGQNAKPDGYTITTLCVELVTLPHSGTGGDLDHRKFAPLCMVNSGYAAVTVHKDSPYNTLAEFVAAAKEGSFQVGNSGIGSIWHLAAAGLEKVAGVEFVHVPFNGAAPAITSLLGQHIDAVTVSYAEVLSQVDAGELKVLAVLAPQRIPSATHVPTAKELGYDVAIGTWRGFGVPVATPAPIVEWLEKVFTEGVKNPAFVKFMNDSKNDIDFLTGAEFGRKMEEDFEMFGRLMKDLGLAAN